MAFVGGPSVELPFSTGGLVFSVGGSVFSVVGTWLEVVATVASVFVEGVAVWLVGVSVARVGSVAFPGDGGGVLDGSEPGFRHLGMFSGFHLPSMVQMASVSPDR